MRHVRIYLISLLDLSMSKSLTSSLISFEAHLLSLLSSRIPFEIVCAIDRLFEGDSRNIGSVGLA